MSGLWLTYMGRLRSFHTCRFGLDQHWQFLATFHRYASCIIPYLITLRLCVGWDVKVCWYRLYWHWAACILDESLEDEWECVCAGGGAASLAFCWILLEPLMNTWPVELQSLRRKIIISPAVNKSGRWNAPSCQGWDSTPEPPGLNINTSAGARSAVSWPQTTGRSWNNAPAPRPRSAHHGYGNRRRL